MRTAITVSIILHLLIFFSIFRVHITPPIEHESTNLSGALRIELVNKEQPDQSLSSASGQGVIPNEEKEFCMDNNKTYKGIGITYSIKTWYILQAPQSYPAYKAGIRVGDYVEDPGYVPNKDDTVDVFVKRNDQELRYHIKQEQICYRD